MLPRHRDSWKLEVIVDNPKIHGIPQGRNYVFNVTWGYLYTCQKSLCFFITNEFITAASPVDNDSGHIFQFKDIVFIYN